MPKEQVLDLFHLYANMVYRLSFSYLRSSHDAEDASIRAEFPDYR